MTESIARFHVGDLISVSSGRLVSQAGMAGVHKLLDHLTGDTLFTHQLPRAQEAVAGGLVEQHPWLTAASEAMPEEFGSEPERVGSEYIDAMVERYGAEHDVAKVAGWLHRDPIAELAERIGPDRVIPVVITNPATCGTDAPNRGTIGP